MKRDQVAGAAGSTRVGIFQKIRLGENRTKFCKDFWKVALKDGIKNYSSDISGPDCPTRQRLARSAGKTRIENEDVK